MARSFVYDRLDWGLKYSFEGWRVDMDEASEGEYVLAQDALDREAVLQAQIRTLEVQLKDAKREAGSYRNAGVWGPNGTEFKTYREENLNGVAMYVKESD
jgi:hypothetical protein